MHTTAVIDSLKQAKPVTSQFVRKKFAMGLDSMNCNSG